MDEKSEDKRAEKEFDKVIAKAEKYAEEAFEKNKKKDKDYLEFIEGWVSELKGALKYEYQQGYRDAYLDWYYSEDDEGPHPTA